jgi:hypothetical protein
MSCGFRLRVNGTWVNVDGVQSGVQIASERPGDEFVSVGGVRHAQRARRAPRTWTVDLGALTGPEQVAALMTAAQGDGGDVMLWDESAARANMLDPVAIAPRPDYPVVMCGDVPLRSLTRGPSGAASLDDVQAKANLAIGSDGMAWDWPGVAAGTQDALLKFSVPTPPPGISLSSAQLILTASASSASGTVTAKLASNAWVETGSGFGGTPTGYWTSIPGGTTAGSAALGAVTTTISLSGVAAYAGSDMSLRLSVAGTGSPNATFTPRVFASGYPILRLNYGADAYPRTFTQHVPADVAQIVSFWTTAADGTVIGTRTVPAGTTTNVTVPATGSSGLRKVSITIAAPGTDYDSAWVLNDSTTYLLAGLGFSTLAHDAYAAPHKTPTWVVVDDPTFSLDSLYANQQGKGVRTVTIREVGA